jgi:hypothetical protein
MNRADIEHVAARARMGDPRAAELARRILRNGLRLPQGHPHRDAARFMASLIRLRFTTRAAYLPQPSEARRTRLARELEAIFKAAGGLVHTKARVT